MTTTKTKTQDRSNEAVELIDAWLNEHAWWADARAIDFALDVRAVLADPAESPADNDEAPRLAAAQESCQQPTAVALGQVVDFQDGRQSHAGG